ncbi:hypothetical protein LCGC14_1300180 [marine sediment metagenome]|uniref:Uncharacterized protein n=1 Tax=marine sediment metagenome TaxID=412755 RepID=A0A0F9NST2_9ZZZZ
MLTLRHRLDTTANGVNQDWAVQFSSTAYEAVLRESADTTYIQSATLNHRSDFDCGNGPHPELGFVSAVTVHYRVQATSIAGAPDMLIDVLRAGAALTPGTTVTPAVASTWVNGEYRIDVDPISGVRFVPSELDDLGIMVQVSTAPTSGYLRVSHLWLEVEWTLSPEFYDPVYHAALPSAITGQMDWNTAGTQATVLVGDQLRLTDSSAVDYRSYTRTILPYGANYVTEVSTRFNLTGSTVGFNYRAALVDDTVMAVELCCFTDAAGDPYVGLTTNGRDHDDPDEYFATYAVDWTDSHHYRLLIDRELDAGDSFGVQVFVDYADTPAMVVNYYKFDGTTGSTELTFGTGSAALLTGQTVAFIDFIDWWHYRKSGSNWRHWHAAEEATNTVTVNSSDVNIVQPITITPPGITAGQSQFCCTLNVTDLTDECSIRTYFAVPSGLGTYDLSLDYRIDTFAEDALLLVQRTSDFSYWNNGGSAWQAASTSVAVPYAATRTHTTFMTAIQTAVPDNLIITIRNDVGAAAAHTVYVYKVDLRD